MHSSPPSALLWGVLVVLIVGVSHVARCQISSWTLATYGPAPAFSSRLLSDGSDIYMVGSVNEAESYITNAFYKVAYKFDIASSRWHRILTSGDIPPMDTYFCHTVKDNKAHIFFSSTLVAGTPSMYTLDLKTFAWKAIMPTTSLSPPPRALAEMAIFNNDLYVFGGQSQRFGTEDVYNDVWKFDISANKWSEYIPQDKKQHMCTSCGMLFDMDTFYFANNSPPNSTSFTVHLVSLTTKFRSMFSIPSSSLTPSVIFFKMQNTFYISSNTPSRTDSFCLFVYNQVSTTQAEYCYPSSRSPKGFPLAAPHPRSLYEIFGLDSSIYFVGMVSGSVPSGPDIWVLDQVSMNWVWNSLSVYPTSRIGGMVVPIDSSRILYYGGTLVGDIRSPVNDLWEINRETLALRLIRRESWCQSADTNCQPLLWNSVAAFFEGYLIMMGVTYEDGELRAFKYKYAGDYWSEFDDLKDAPTHFTQNTILAFVQSGSYIWIWQSIGDMPFGDCANNFYRFDITNAQFQPIPAHSSCVVPRTRTSMFVRDEDVCYFSGLRSGYAILSDQACYRPNSGDWQLSTFNWPAVVSSPTATYYGTQIVLEPRNSDLTTRLHQLVDGRMVAVATRANPPAGVAILSNFIMDSTLVAVVELSTIVRPIILYQINLEKYFCDGETLVTVTVPMILDDGSGPGSYFPGTKCRWSISKASWMMVEMVSLSVGTELTINGHDCYGNELLSQTFTGGIPIPPNIIGQYIRVPSQIEVRLEASKTAYAEKGFQLRFLACSVGFIVRYHACYCPPSSFVTPNGECMPCVDSLMGVYSRHPSCIDPSFSRTTVPVTAQRVPGNIYQMSASLSSLGYLRMASWSLNATSPTNLYALSIEGRLMSASIADIFNWKPTSIEFPGNPFIEEDAQLTSIGQGLLLIGGGNELERADAWICDLQLEKWISIDTSPFNGRSGMVMVSIGDLVILHGGFDSIQFLFKSETWTLHTGTLKWTQITSSKGPELSHSAFGVYNAMVYVYGGLAQHGEENVLWSFNIAKQSWIRYGDPAMTGCVSCEQMSSCEWRRWGMYFAMVGPELHIFGGYSQNIILNDVFIISVATNTIEYYRNHDGDNLQPPFKSPQPRHGGSSLQVGNLVYISGGKQSAGQEAPDHWIWSAVNRTWWASSHNAVPLQRRDSNMVQVSTTEHVMFGGLTKYVGDNFLNDLWMFRSDSNTWTLLSGLSTQSDVPVGRSQHGMFCTKRKVYVFGGRQATTPMDPRIWVYDLDLSRWSVASFTYLLLMNEKPTWRFSFGWALGSSAGYMFGGRVQDIPGHIENYQTIVRFNFDSMRIETLVSTTSTPRPRVGPSLAYYNYQLWLFGGRSFSGEYFDDVWAYHLGGNVWKQLPARVTKGTQLGPQSMATYLQYAIFLGLRESGDVFSSIFDFEKSLFVTGAEKSNFRTLGRLDGFNMCPSSSGPIIFGGQGLRSLSYALTLYSPGYCTDGPPIWIPGAKTAILLTDGSQESSYFPGSRCSWYLFQSNLLNITTELAEGDRLYVDYTGSDSVRKQLLLSGRSQAVLWNSRSGFNITMTADFPKSRITGQGFVIYHSVCPVEANLQSSGQCKCPPGTDIDIISLSCIQVPTEAHETPASSDKFPVLQVVQISIPAIVIFVICSILIFYRAHIVVFIQRKLKGVWVSDITQITFTKLVEKDRSCEIYDGKVGMIPVRVWCVWRQRHNFTEMHDFQRMIKRRSLMPHANIVPISSILNSSAHLIIVVPVSRRDLLYDVMHIEKRCLSNAVKNNIMLGVAKGMRYLHSQKPPIICKSLSSKSIMLDRSLNASICDVGYMSSCWSVCLASVAHMKALYLAPEVICRSDYGELSDAYCFGVFAWELISETRPESLCDHGFAFLQRRLNGEPPFDLVPDIPELWSDVLNGVWTSDRAQRMKLDEVLRKLKLYQHEDNHSGAHQNRVQIYVQGPASDLQQRFTLVCLSFEDLGPASALLLSSEVVEKTRNVIQTVLGTCHGLAYNTRTDSQSFYFSTSTDSIRFCCDVQRLFYAIEWSEDVRDSIGFQQRPDGFQGLHLRIATSSGMFRPEDVSPMMPDNLTNKTYLRTHALMIAALGGQTLLTQDVYKDIEQCGLQGAYAFRLICDSSQLLEDVTTSIYEVLPHELCIRSSFLSRYDERFIVRAADPSFVGSEDGRNTTFAMGNKSDNIIIPARSIDQGPVLSEKFEWLHLKRCTVGAIVSWIVPLPSIDQLGKKEADLKREFARIRSLDHPNILMLIGLSFDNHVPLLAYQYFESTSLRLLLDDVPSTLDWPTK
eukprot:TRINITY_DN7477_c0_g1_i4.p1 TRINITY_DN7477_c0_g1~~TRINITY_DN7477_c0_g1_i4.p1  ORF type:complete len:2287 (+),score=316.75 TRINITY_DN7477_c0_g1_i4:53-6913(+)